MTAVFVLFTFLILAGCSSVQVPVSSEPTVIPLSKIPTLAPQPTASETSVPTVTPTMTLEPTLIVNPENLVLAEQGYDIADVRLSYPGEDTLVVDFKYRLDQSRESRDTYISMTIPPQCRDDGNRYSPPQYVTKKLSGEVRFTFKLTLEGTCSTDAIEFIFYSDPNKGTTFYREYVLQPYELVRNFPTVNSDTLQVQNFQFTDNSSWKGVFTFDYRISEEIPFPKEQYRFVVRGFGPDGGCAFWAEGAVLTDHSGEYQVPLDLTYNLLFPFKNCLDGLDQYTFTSASLSLIDTIAEKSIYHQEFNISYTMLKKR
jgi:hypothetical protein